MIIQELSGEFAVCMLNHGEKVQRDLPFFFYAQTDEEISLVCPEADAPLHCLAREDGWKAFRIKGTLDFSMIGVLAEISSLLAQEKISIFVVSTYKTDTFLVKKEKYSSALAKLKRAGHTVENL